jgi:hypothetical protein
MKSCHHAVFNKAWHLQPTRHPATQLLNNLGLEANQDFVSINGPVLQPLVGLISPITVAWPPLADTTSTKTWECPRPSLFVPLPLRVTEAPNVLTAAAARIHKPAKPLSGKDLASEVVTQYLIGPHDMEHIYMSSDLYGRLFEAALDLRKWDYTKHHTAGLRFFPKSGQFLLATMDPSTPGAKVDKWQTQLWGAWLISIDGLEVSTIAAAQEAFAWLSETSHHTCTLVFSHPHISPDISNCSVPIMSRDNFSQFTHD